MAKLQGPGAIMTFCVFIIVAADILWRGDKRLGRLGGFK